jgi:lysophospholipase L1-like esterase
LRTSRKGISVWAGRVILSALGLLAALLLLELGLRVASRFYGFRPDSGPSGEGRQTILALGDSHTYGVFYSPEESYPGQLEALLELRAPNRYRVVNLGLPGMNSSEVATRLESWYLEYRPALAVLCVGVNNLWNNADTSPESSDGLLAGLVAKLRLARLARLLAFRLRTEPQNRPVERPRLRRVLLDQGRAGVEHRDADTGELVVRHRGNPHEPAVSMERARALLHRDLESILSMSEAMDVRLVLLTYPSFHLSIPPSINEEIRGFSSTHGVSLVDAADRFRELLADPPKAPTELFHAARDSHPNPRGYSEMATLIADEIEDLDGSAIDGTCRIASARSHGPAPSAARQRQAERGHLLAVAEQQHIPDQRRLVPGPALDCLDTCKLGEAVRGRRDEGELRPAQVRVEGGGREGGDRGPSCPEPAAVDPGPLAALGQRPGADLGRQVGQRVEVADAGQLKHNTPPGGDRLFQPVELVCDLAHPSRGPRLALRLPALGAELEQVGRQLESVAAMRAPITRSALGPRR